MNGWDLLKTIFPKPKLQKRYMIGLCAVIYLGLKVYVSITPDPMDDMVLEQAKEIAMQILAEADQVDVPVEVAIPEPGLK